MGVVLMSLQEMMLKFYKCWTKKDLRAFPKTRYDDSTQYLKTYSRDTALEILLSNRHLLYAVSLSPADGLGFIHISFKIDT